MLKAMTLTLLALVSAAAGSADQVVTAELGSTGNVHEIDGMLLASQPGAADLALARDKGIRTVINLRLPAEPAGFDEPAEAARLGLKYVALPWNGGGELTDQVFDEARRLLRESPRPLLMHCGSGNRVATVWLPWRVLDSGAEYDEALEEARIIGLVTPEYEQKARDYIERHRISP